jgi:hypothetical protein
MPLPTFLLIHFSSPGTPFMYHLLCFLPIPNPFSPHQKPFFFSSLLSYISLPLFNIFFFFFFYNVLKIKVTIFLMYYISHDNCHPSSSLVSISIYFMTSPNFYSYFLIFYYKCFPFLSFTHPRISLSSAFPYLKETAKITTI